jgi:HSP20 family protein
MDVPVRNSRSSALAQNSRAPFGELTELEQRLGSLVDGLWPTSAIGDGTWSPLVDIAETDGAWLVEADLPGARKDDIDVTLSGADLSITGKVKEREHAGARRRRARRTGRFEYRVKLPSEADPETIDASLKDGVLTVSIPKPEQTKPQAIEINS